MFTHARVLKDTAEGLVAELVTAKGRLTRREAAETPPESLGGLLNSVYRCLKNERDGTRRAVLQRPVGGPAVMEGQLKHLLAMAEHALRPVNSTPCPLERM